MRRSPSELFLNQHKPRRRGVKPTLFRTHISTIQLTGSVFPLQVFGCSTCLSALTGANSLFSFAQASKTMWPSGYENVKQPLKLGAKFLSSLRNFTMCCWHASSGGRLPIVRRAAADALLVHDNYQRQVPQNHWCVALHAYYSTDKRQPYTPTLSPTDM